MSIQKMSRADQAPEWCSETCTATLLGREGGIFFEAVQFAFATIVRLHFVQVLTWSISMMECHVSRIPGEWGVMKEYNIL